MIILFDRVIWINRSGCLYYLYFLLTERWSASRTLLDIFSGKYNVRDREREPTYCNWEITAMHPNPEPVLYFDKFGPWLTGTWKYKFLFLYLKNISKILLELLIWVFRSGLPCHAMYNERLAEKAGECWTVIHTASRTRHRHRSELSL